jgi:hypothetical protein
MNKNDNEFNNLVDDLNTLNKQNYELINENNTLKTELNYKSQTNNKLLEYKPEHEKLKKIKKIIKNTNEKQYYIMRY